MDGSIRVIVPSTVAAEISSALPAYLFVVDVVAHVRRANVDIRRRRCTPVIGLRRYTRRRLGKSSSRPPLVAHQNRGSSPWAAEPSGSSTSQSRACSVVADTTRMS